MTKLIILDRDGVINFDSAEYIKSPDEWHAIPGSLDAIARLNRAGYRIAVASNQSGVGRGLYDEAMLSKIHEKMQAELARFGGVIDKIFYCPHRPEEHCACRKPKPGMFLEIAEHFQCSLDNVPFVGDKKSDVEVALTVHAKPILVHSENYDQVLDDLVKRFQIEVYTNLTAFTDHLLQSTITEG
ncbi:MAG: D-glycero-beta-D-manno-heptose 1,7-bisphosphate 7-phosphatase [Proteobacteria bacterium]|nr:D-glycero-beta-D-manno-heptose 1,7-bisphosphate 7-phosphatase [Pseudomonadota bacterium]